MIGAKIIRQNGSTYVRLITASARCIDIKMESGAAGERLLRTLFDLAVNVEAA